MASSWGTRPISDLPSVELVLIRLPDTVIPPASGSSSPQTIEMVVVFPAPLGPSKP